ncbi:MAG: hypothetical protein ACR2H3_10155 [Acidimicrobiales bacterium]
MIRVFLLAGGLFLIVGVIYLAMASARMVKRSAWPGDSPQYRNHLAMARWIERHLRDDMVAVTIQSAEKTEAARLLEQFYGERQVGGGD